MQAQEKDVANATLRAKLRKLGFNRSVESWEKNKFNKHIGNVEVTALIDNDSMFGQNWAVREVTLKTTRFDEMSVSIVSDKTSITTDESLELTSTLLELEALK